MLVIPKHLREYVEIEEGTGKLLVADNIPKEHEFEVKLIKKGYETAMDPEDLTEY
jgi:bifunctional DNA-binding transcriptional regulator/antitoxin component of YhaV-PrlF toxin-antitoxin module